MDTELLSFLLGTAVAVIAVLVTGIGITLRAYGRPASNPNMDTMDTKLNTILIVLTRIEAKLGGHQ